jgi:hypothetical protein
LTPPRGKTRDKEGGVNGKSCKATGTWKSYLLELLDGTLINSSALVDQVTSGGGLSGIDVADNDHVNVHLLLT